MSLIEAKPNIGLGNLHSGFHRDVNSSSDPPTFTVFSDEDVKTDVQLEDMPLSAQIAITTGNSILVQYNEGEIDVTETEIAPNIQPTF